MESKQPKAVREANRNRIWSDESRQKLSVGVKAAITPDRVDACRAMGQRNLGSIRPSFRKRPYHSAYCKLTRDAENRDISCQLSYEDFVAMADRDMNCHYCNASTVRMKHLNSRIDGKGSRAHFVDRKDSSLGYSIENCVTCCSRCNMGKSNRFTYEEWYAMTEVLRTKI